MRYPLKRKSRELQSPSGTFQGKVILSPSGASGSRYHDTVSAAFNTTLFLSLTSFYLFVGADGFCCT